MPFSSHPLTASLDPALSGLCSQRTTQLTLPTQSSAASQGLFGNLNTHKRGSEDYGERRASYTEMAGNSPGMVSGWFNRTFKGHMDKPGATMGNDGKMMGMGTEQQKKEDRRGVME
jgi:hypothetical protein